MARYNKVLLVDDHGIVREGAALHLRSIHPEIEVLHAKSIEEGRIAVEQAQPDLVFLDLRFDDDPRAGLELLRWMKSETKFDQIPVIVMSGEPMDRKAIDDLLGEKAAGFLSKGKADSAHIFRLAMQSMEEGAVFIHGLRTVVPGATEVEPRRASRSLASLGLNDGHQRVLELHVLGTPYKSIARKTGLAEATVKEYVADMCRMFKVENAKALIYEIARAGVVMGGDGTGGACMSSSGEASTA